jgi:hypothetical protein
MLQLAQGYSYCDHDVHRIKWRNMTYTGLSGETKINYFTKWLHDENRYNPTNQHPLILTDLYMNISHNQSPTKHPCEIPEKCWNILRRCLHDNKFSKTCILSIIGIMKMDKPLSYLRRFLLGTSLRDKLHFAMNIRATEGVRAYP